MSDSKKIPKNITDHVWSDAVYSGGDEKIIEFSQCYSLNEDDAIAIAKHFGDYRNTEQLNNIAEQLQYWIDYSGKTSGDSHIFPPMWPTKCQLENWIKALNGDDLDVQYFVNNTDKPISIECQSPPINPVVESVDQVITNSILENIHQSETKYTSKVVTDVGDMWEYGCFAVGPISPIGEIKENQLFNTEDDIHG